MKKYLHRVLASSRRKLGITGVIYTPYVLCMIYVNYLSPRCLGGLMCDGSVSSHSVPALYSGSLYCRQICATVPELIRGYSIWLIVYFIAPLLMLYVIAGVVTDARSQT